jgi:hypothetical protein
MEYSEIDKGPACWRCRHLRREVSGTCDAYPGGIPIEIKFGEAHDKPMPGDRGIQFDTEFDALMRSTG